MLQKFIDAANANPAVLAVIMCVIGVALTVFMVCTDKTRKILKRKIRQMNEVVETRERLIVHQRQRIKDLKTELFALGMDKKISEEKLTKRIEKLETEKKQFLKWGSEK